MQEALLQFIWQYSLYRADGLRTTDGQPVTVVHPGVLNRDAGPDFSAARIRIGSTLLVGNIELHVRSSDWIRHGHGADGAYKNIILHVVHRADADATPGVPVLELGPYIPEYVVDKYTHLLQTPQPIPCGRQHAGIPGVLKEGWLGRVLAERWEERLEGWAARLEALAGDWNRLFYERLAAGFGFKINAEPFLELARQTPLHLLLRHRESLEQLEALLLGQAGFLDAAFDDEYPKRLQQEYRFLKGKYNLENLPAYRWKFLRMRPANFPTVRLAQFAALLHRGAPLFSALMESASAGEALRLLDVQAGPYWDTHVRLGDAQAKAQPKRLGRLSAENLLLNVVAPMRFLVAHEAGNADGREAAIRFLEALPPEDNQILRLWQETGWEARNAANSQALLQLFRSYCTPKRCLECAVGLRVLRSQA